MSELLQRMRQFAKETPSRIAYQTAIVKDDSFSISKITWQELEEKSNIIAGWIYKHNDKTPVVIYGHKSPYMIILFIACVKSGCAYVPIDSSTPEHRIYDIINKVNPNLIFNTEEISLNVTDKLVLREEEIIDKIVNTPSSEDIELPYIANDDTFYIIFTSGSTGTPKGVQISSDCLDNFLKWSESLTGRYSIAEDGRCSFINQAPFSFDLSVFDVYTSLYTGGTICSIPKKLIEKAPLLQEFLRSTNASIWVSTPSFAEMMLADKNFSSELMPEMKTFLFCGEILTNNTAKKLHSAFPGSEVINTYGPTESTVAVTNVTISEEIISKYNILPLGKAKPGTWIYIMDESGRILPEKEKGEIVIIGDTVSTGYFKNVEKNREAFSTYTIEGREYRLYHTHDTGYYSDGYLFYCGRIDKQIKLHGYRIEIEDIENNILESERVDRVVVIPEYVEGKINSLIAYIIPKNKIESALKERQHIRNELKKRIPEYMIPKKFIFKDSLPMTTNGKVDRKKLEAEL